MTRTRLSDTWSMLGDLSPGTFHWGTADCAGLLIYFHHVLSARKTSLDPNTECIEVNNIICRAHIPLSCNSSSVKAKQTSDFGLVEGGGKKALVGFSSIALSFTGKSELQHLYR